MKTLFFVPDVPDRSLRWPRAVDREAGLLTGFCETLGSPAHRLGCCAKPDLSFNKACVMAVWGKSASSPQTIRPPGPGSEQVCPIGMLTEQLLSIKAQRPCRRRRLLSTTHRSFDSQRSVPLPNEVAVESTRVEDLPRCSRPGLDQLDSFAKNSPSTP